MKTIGGKHIDNLGMSIAIFYDQTEWHSLILNAILPFVEKTKEVDDFFLSLSRNRGNHVKLFLLTSKSEAKKLVQKADSYFNDFIGDHKISNKESLFSQNGIFRDFESNTVHYGLYDFYLSTSPNNSIYFQKEFSQLLIAIFKKHREETISSLTEIMIVLFALFYDSSSFKKIEVVQLFDKLLETEYQKYNTETLKKSLVLNETNFVENKAYLVSFLKNKAYLSREFEEQQKLWSTIVTTYYEKSGYRKKNKVGYLIDMLCNVFDLEDRISAYYLFVNALKLT